MCVISFYNEQEEITYIVSRKKIVCMFLITYKSHYLVFKELFLFEKSTDLSKLSKTIRNLAKITRINFCLSP